MRLLVPLILLIGLCACSGTSEYRHTSGAAWGTLYHITYRAERDLSDSVVAEMRRVELSLSMFDSLSTVSKVNRGATDVVDSMFARVFAASQLVHRVSGGAFDPTVAPLVNLWGFGYTGDGEEEPPAQAVVMAELAKVGLGDCRLDSLRLTRKHPQTQFDFSAIAKGFGVDCVAEMLRRCGASDYMVEIGGEVAVAGVNPHGTPWRIAVEVPEPGADGQSISTVELSQGAVATSGNYRNFRQAGADSVYGHTISPVTGYPVATETASATVIAPSCMLADALATACMVLPAQKALALADSVPGVSIMLVSPAPGGGWNVMRSKERLPSRQP